jgi:hypothetical protein
MMFDPEAAKNAKAIKAAKKKVTEGLKDLALSIIPPDLQEGLLLNVKEIICGDPECAPIDTVLSFVWPKGRGMYAMPMAPEEITEEDLVDYFPDEETLRAWFAGEKREWPPYEPPAVPKVEDLRFGVGLYVECRVGPDPVTGWAPGRITKQLYREANWPADTFAPYQIELDDGRLIFAPQDTDTVIRRSTDPSRNQGTGGVEPTPPPVAPSSSGAS